MKVWTFAKDRADCGACQAVIGQGELYLSIELDGVKRKKARCAACADHLFAMTPPAIVKAPPTPPRREPPPVQNARMQGVARVASMRRLQGIVREPRPAALPVARSHQRRTTAGPRPGVLPTMYDAKMAAAGRDD